VPRDVGTGRGLNRAWRGAILSAIAGAFLASPAASQAESPAAPLAAGPGISEIVQVVEISSVSASPDGAAAAFRTEQARIDSNSHLLSWHVADVERGTVVELGGGGEAIYAEPGILVSEPAIWAPDGTAIFYRALVEDAIGIWRARIDGSGGRLVFRDGSDVESIRLEGASATLVLGPTRDEVRAAERREYLDGILIDESVALNQNLFRSGYVNGRLATQRLTGPWFTRVGLLWDLPRRQRSLDLLTLEVGASAPAPAPEAPAELAVDPGLTARSPAGEVARAVRENGETRVEVRPAAGGAPIRCSAPVCSERIVALAWRPGTRQILLTAQDMHLGQSLHLWDPATGRVRTLLWSDGFLSGGRDGQTPCALTRVAAICVTASAVSPPRLERIDLETGARTVLFDPNAALRRSLMPAVERLAWTTSEGENISGILLLPRNASGQRLPLFLNYYRCGGFLSGGVGDELPLLPLAGAGMAVACINAPAFAGVEDFLGRYDRALRAVASLVELLDERGLIDRRRVGMAGLSFGSEVTMWTLVHSDLLAAAAIASSQIEPAYYWVNSVRGRSQPEVLRRFWGLGSPDETPEAWRRHSAALNVDRISAPLLLQLPEQEARNVIELYSRLSRSPIPTELYAFPDAAHLKLQPRHRLAAHQRYFDWFRYWLQDHVDSDPARAGQYRRWQLLRERWRSEQSARP
jgi:hypothetical protein